jgi:hypothetical protein
MTIKVSISCCFLNLMPRDDRTAWVQNILKKSSKSKVHVLLMVERKQTGLA